MKLLFVDFTLPYLLKDSQYPVGGYSVELSIWLSSLVASNYKVGVLTWEGANKYVNKNLEFTLLDTYDPKKGVKIAKYFYSYIPKLIKVANKYQPDVIVQACSGLNTGIMAFVAKKINVPFIYRVANDLDVDSRCESKLKKYQYWAYLYGLKRASAIICQNSYQYDSLIKKYPNKPMIIIHNPFDTTKVNKVIKTRSDRKYIAWLGVFSKQKNLPLLLEIAKNLPHVNFKIAGMPGKSMDEKTKSAISVLATLSNVEFTGYIKRENICHFLDSAIALLSTSHYEGFSNTFLEAFSTGLPVIAPKRVDPDLIITKNGLGLTVANDDGLSELIDIMYKKSDLEYDDLASKCKNFLINNFSPKIKAEQLVTFLGSL
jgi:glycosyltransferase involved in cell wall biosynthesis